MNSEIRGAALSGDAKQSKARMPACRRRKILWMITGVGGARELGGASAADGTSGTETIGAQG